MVGFVAEFVGITYMPYQVRYEGYTCESPSVDFNTLGVIWKSNKEKIMATAKKAPAKKAAAKKVTAKKVAVKKYLLRKHQQ